MATVNELARALNLTPQRVQQLVKHDGMPRATRGQYQIGACMAWYIRYLQKAIQARSSEQNDGTVSNLTSERTRHARAVAERLEVENAKRRGELVRAEDVDRYVSAAIARSREMWLSMPARMTKELAGQDERNTFRILTDEVRRLLQAYAADLEQSTGLPAEDLEPGDRN